ncbi:hypothetical protein SISNIDRAFT_461492 [Sistotremastrum niveocremeum HHB9708]|uniref:DUF6535 domain-containing protein n=1 Tax=Sistotremastrum niveocremeum HHB9708 TaxID=1314777 RepID=A0A164MK05_9AGAM|nr:hypothetical protein SISNIDRAFT_461492 [Sistotremastrum niveocremeum HHB9708]
MADPATQSTLKEPSWSAISDLGQKFDVMIELMKSHISIVTEQSKTQAEQSQILKDHSKMLEALEKDATRDDKPFDGRGLRDELTWGALDKEALAKIKVTVDGWRDLMNVSLIFIALFLTVVTAFISPVIQAFSTPPNDSSSTSSSLTRLPLPPTSLQLVALFYYMALMVSIFNSVLCVLGMQWAGKLLATPIGKSNLERTLLRERRKVLAERRLLPLMGVLFWTLLASIAFFVAGFLIQFWALSFSFDGRAPILIAGAISATAMAITILGIILATTYHATVYENSPFESPLSSATRAAWTYVRHSPRINLFDTRYLTRWLHRQPSTSGEVGPTSEASAKESAVVHQTTPETMEEPIELLLIENQNDTENVQALKAYARLVLSANNAEVLERAVPSFAIAEWYQAGTELWNVFLAVRERFLATDTSFQVKQTVDKQLAYFVDWQRSRRDIMNPSASPSLEKNSITDWCRDRCSDLVNRSDDSEREFFPSLVFFTSLEPNNSNLWWEWDSSYEECVARVLSSFDQEGKPGRRGHVFELAIRHCTSLLFHGRSEDVTRILSHCNKSSLLRSLLRNPHVHYPKISKIFELITRGNELAILQELANFFSDPQIMDMNLIPHSGFPNLVVLDFLDALIPSLPSNFIIPRSFDLSQTLALFMRFKKRLVVLNSRQCRTLLYYLDHGGFEAIRSLRSMHDFLQLCLVPSEWDPDTNNAERARFYLCEYHEAFTALPESSQSHFDDLFNALATHRNDETSTVSEDNFVDAVRECNSLIKEHKRSEIQDILSRVDHLNLLESFIQSPHLRIHHISSLVSRIIEGKELIYVRDLGPIIAHLPSLMICDQYIPVIEFLAHILKLLPSEFTAPRELDLSRLIPLFTQSEPNEETWRKYSDTLMQYLHCGAFDSLSDLNSVRRFLDLCTETGGPFNWWNSADKTSDSTRERATALKNKLPPIDSPSPAILPDAAAAVGSDDAKALCVLREENPESATQTRAFFQRLRNIWDWTRRTGITGASEDVEKAMKK